MRILAFIVVLGSFISWGQNSETRMANVENGLTLQRTVSSEQAITTKTIYDAMKQSKINGVSVAVIHNGEIEWSKTYGVASANNSNPLTKETLFQCASIGKVITALAALKLVEDGFIDLDLDVNTKLKRWNFKENDKTKAQEVTLRHLLSHTAGLTDDYGFLGYSPNKEIPSLMQVINNESPAKAKKSLEIKTVPGTVQRYSGAGYIIIQMLIEDLSGLSFSDYVNKHIFKPLQMIHTTYNDQPDKNLGKQIASGHLSNGKSLKKKDYNVYPEKAAAGPWTTAEDLAKLIIAIQKNNNQILSENLISELLTPQINHKGLGVNLKGLDEPDAFWHAGQNLGYTALFFGLTSESNGAVVLTNSDGGEYFIQEFITSVAMEYNWPVMKSNVTYDIPEKLQTNLVGEYNNTEKGKSITIKENNGKLYVHPTGSKKSEELLMIAENHFTFKNAQDYYKLSFNYDSSNKVASLIYTESIGNTIRLTKNE